MNTAIHKSLKLFAFVMSFLVLIVSLPMYAFAGLVDTSSSEADAIETEQGKSEVLVICEEEDLREENVKHFKLSDGTSKAVIYTQPVHYRDSEGKLVDIDNALTLNGNEYSAKNKLEIKLASKSGSSGLISIKDGEYKIDFTPKNADKVSVEIENPQKTNSRKFDDIKALTNLVSKATYKGIYEGIDLEYILVGNNIKENIIVNKAQDSYTYSFEIKLNKLVAELKDGAVILSDYDSGEQVYKIPAPYMLDANGAYSEAVEYTLTQESKWKYTLTITADPNWINAEDRAFPVTIDPTVVVGENDSSTTINAYVYKNDVDEYPDNPTVFFDPYALLVGNYMGNADSRAFVKIKNLPTIPVGTVLANAKIYMGVQNSGNEIEVAVYKATADWTSGLTYANRDDYIGSTKVSVKFDSSHLQAWDITSIYREWLTTPTTYHGVCFKGKNMPSADETSTWAFLVAVAHPDYVHPTYELTYANLQGVEEYYGMQENTLGDYGKSYVNLYNGGLTYVNKLTTITNGSISYDINMVYDSIEKKWMGSFEESITPYEADNFIRYKWVDGDGTTHWFSPYMERIYWGQYVYYNVDAVGQKTQTQNPTEFYPEDDIDYVLTKTTTGELILKDYNGNQKMFDTSGRLSKICDAQGNVLFLSYENEKLSFIDCKTYNNELVAKAKFLYENERLVCVYDYITKLEVSLVWCDNGLVDIEYNEIDDTKDNTVSVNYITNSDNIEKISDDLEAKYLKYIFNTNGTVSAIQMYNASNALQAQYNIVYSVNNTTCTDLGADLSASADDSSEEYTFDVRGRNASVTYDDLLLPDNIYYSAEYSENIYEQGGNLVQYNVTTGEKNFFDVTEQNISFDLTDIVTSSTIPNEGNSRDMVCKIKANFNDGVQRHGTGFLVGPNTLVMSAHGILKDTTSDGVFNLNFPTSITVTPGCNKNGESAPYGNFQVTTCFVQKEYYYLEESDDPEKYQYDWAVCTLNENIGNQLDWFELIVPDESIIEQYALVYGYHGTTDLLRRSAGQIIEFQGEEVVHLANTVSGMSGGPTFLSNTEYVVFGINVAVDEYSYAKRIDPIIYTLVNNLNSMEAE